MMDKQELMKVLLYCYAGLCILFAYLVYRFFDSEIKRLNPPRKPFLPLKGSDIISVSLPEAESMAEALKLYYKMYNPYISERKSKNRNKAALNGVNDMRHGVKYFKYKQIEKRLDFNELNQD